MANKNQCLVAAELLGSLSAFSEHQDRNEWTLLLPQRSRYISYKSGACSAAPLKDGGLLTAGHCIRSESLPGSVLNAGFIAATVWQQTKTLKLDGQTFIEINTEKFWQPVELISGRFQADGPDWALLSSTHNLPGYEIANVNPIIGDSCHIIGYPLGLSLREVATGKIVEPIRESADFFWLDCRISNGVSGAPVIDTNNKLLGIVAGETTTDSGIFTRVQLIPEEVLSL